MHDNLVIMCVGRYPLTLRTLRITILLRETGLWFLKADRIRKLRSIGVSRSRLERQILRPSAGRRDRRCVRPPVKCVL
jgi:hypothetical protein